jgi:ribosomal protein L14E/L6E/L27E
MANFNNGDIVKAIAGREKEELFIIYNIDNNFAYLVNGRSRQIENPKKKNIKHLFLLCRSELSNINFDKLTNALVINYLKDYNKSKDYK